MHFLILLIAVALLSVISAEKQCNLANWYNHNEKVEEFNSILAFAADSGLLKQMLTAYDPITLENQKLFSKSKKILGITYELNVFLQKVHVEGISGLDIKPVKVSSKESILTSIAIEDTTKLDLTLQVQLKQLTKSKFICFGKPQFGGECKPKSLAATAKVGIKELTVSIDTLLKVMMCEGELLENKAACTNLSAGDFIASLVTGQFDAFKLRGLKRVVDLALRRVDLDFEKITELDVDFNKGGAIVDFFVDLIVDGVKNAMDKDMIQNLVLKVAGKIAVKKVNEFIKKDLAPHFGSTCYDRRRHLRF